MCRSKNRQNRDVEDARNNLSRASDQAEERRHECEGAARRFQQEIEQRGHDDIACNLDQL